MPGDKAQQQFNSHDPTIEGDLTNLLLVLANTVLFWTQSGKQ